MNRFSKNNSAVVSGVIVSDFKYNHEMFGEKFYAASLSIERLSGISDILEVMVSERLVDVHEKWSGQAVKITGQVRTYGKHECNKNRICVFVFAREFEVFDKENFENDIVLDGYICKVPTYRKTMNGREISELIIAVNRPYGKSDYIPCITWGRNAVFSSRINVGEHIKIEGRLQSREYVKKFEDGTQETRVTYEVSASKIGIIAEER